MSGTWMNNRQILCVVKLCPNEQVLTGIVDRSNRFRNFPLTFNVKFTYLSQFVCINLADFVVVVVEATLIPRTFDTNVMMVWQHRTRKYISIFFG